jgi:hypothetical protein
VASRRRGAAGACVCVCVCVCVCGCVCAREWSSRGLSGRWRCQARRGTAQHSTARHAACGTILPRRAARTRRHTHLCAAVLVVARCVVLGHAPGLAPQRLRLDVAVHGARLKLAARARGVCSGHGHRRRWRCAVVGPPFSWSCGWAPRSCWVAVHTVTLAMNTFAEHTSWPGGTPTTRARTRGMRPAAPGAWWGRRRRRTRSAHCWGGSTWRGTPGVCVLGCVCWGCVHVCFRVCAHAWVGGWVHGVLARCWRRCWLSALLPGGCMPTGATPHAPRTCTRTWELLTPHTHTPGTAQR